MDVLFFSFMMFWRRLFFDFTFICTYWPRSAKCLFYNCWNNFISANLFKQLQNKRFTEYNHYCYIDRNYFILNNTLFIYLYLFIILYICIVYIYIYYIYICVYYIYICIYIYMYYIHGLFIEQLKIKFKIKKCM